MAGMAKRSWRGLPLIALLTLVALPVFLIAIAIFEEVVIGTHYMTMIYRRLGVFTPLDWLVDKTIGHFID